jgi:hypothetical protein
MNISERIVIANEVRMLSAADSWICVKKTTIDFTVSKIVCLQVNAMVNPRVIMIKRRSCLLNSLLKFSPPMKKSLILFSIFFID